MLMSQRYRITSTIWKVAIIVFLIFSFFDPTMLIFAMLAAGMSYLAHRRSKQAEEREAMEGHNMEPAKRSALKAVKGPAGAKKGKIRTRRRK